MSVGEPACISGLSFEISDEQKTGGLIGGPGLRGLRLSCRRELEEE